MLSDKEGARPLEEVQIMTDCQVHPSGAQFFVRVVSSNGNILANSERYTTKANALNCARLLAGGGRVTDKT